MAYRDILEIIVDKKGYLDMILPKMMKKKPLLLNILPNRSQL